MYWAVFQFFLQKYYIIWYYKYYEYHTLFDAALLVQKIRGGSITMNKVLNNYDLRIHYTMFDILIIIYLTQKVEFLRS